MSQQKHYYSQVMAPPGKSHLKSKITQSALQHYYDETARRKTRADLKLAVSLVTDKKIAVDCGCGAGADIQYLLDNDFFVHAFDIEKSAIDRCRQRFADIPQVDLSQSSFINFEYPPCQLVVADASLFFCPPEAFAAVWQKVDDSLQPGGVFCGSFLGPEDTMAREPESEQTFWKTITVLTEQEVRLLFEEYHVLRFTEHKRSGLTPQGTPHDWHIYAVVAQKG